MYQNLVISPLFLKSFSSLSSDIGFSIMSYLATEVFLCDTSKKLLEEYDSLKEEYKLDSNALLFIETFINNITVGKVKFVSNSKFNGRDKLKWNLYEFEKSLACFDEWKIILTNSSDSEIKQHLEKDFGIELSDANNYFCPTEKSRIRTIQRITKNPGDEFNFSEWIKKFIKDSNLLIIHDGYACAKNEFRDLEYMIRIIPNGSLVKVITLSDKARNDSRRNNSNDKINAKDKLQELKNKYRKKTIEWEFKEDKKLIEDRHIQTDKFIIDLGHCLGSTVIDNKTGKIICKKQFTIAVSKL